MNSRDVPDCSIPVSPVSHIDDEQIEQPIAVQVPVSRASTGARVVGT